MVRNYYLKTALLYFVLSITYNAFCQELVPFQVRYPAEGEDQIIKGDMRVIGNSVLGILGDNSNELETDFDYKQNDEYDGSSSNNRVTRAYIDIDSDDAFNGQFNGALPGSERDYDGAINTWGSPLDPDDSDTGTFSSSAAELIIENEEGPDGVSCSRVIKAFLYWGGIYPVETDNRNLAASDLLSRPDCNDCEFYTEIKILPPNATEYVDIKYDNTGEDHTSLKSEVIFDGLFDRPFTTAAGEAFPNNDGDGLEGVKDRPYVCFADVTSLFENLQDNAIDVEGLWTVANVRGTTGNRTNGSGAGWSLAVIYQDPFSSVQRSITFFDGFALIQAGQNPVEFNIDGFATIPEGPVNVDIATVALEGDVGLRNDKFEINDQTDAGAASPDWIPLTYPGADANNFYDSSIFGKVEFDRFPSSSNTLGYDSDHFNINNPNNDYIGNDDTEADFRLVTTGDSYNNFFNAFSVEVIAPDLQVVKRVLDDTGQEISLTDLVELGDTIEYVITITNIGNDNAEDIRFSDLIPINTLFTDEGITLDGIPVGANENLEIDPDAESIDIFTQLSFTTTEISFDIPDEDLLIGSSVEVKFRVQVVEDCSQLQDVCTNQITNIAFVSFQGEINTNRVNDRPSVFDVEVCDDDEIELGPTVILSDQFECEDIGDAEEVSRCGEIAILDIGDADGFVSFEWFFLGAGATNDTVGTRLTENADGSPILDTDTIITVEPSGLYRVRAIKDPSALFTRCISRTFFFDVELFDPNSLPANPFEEIGEPLEPVCADNGVEIYEIQFCNAPIVVDPQIASAISYSWRRHDGSCDITSENCVFPQNCYVPVSDEETFTIDSDEDAGEYRLVVELVGNCVFDYYFNIVPIGIDPVLTVVGGRCSDTATLSISGVPFTTDEFINYRASFDINGDITQLPLGENELVVTQPDPNLILNVQGIITPVNSAGEPINDICEFVTNEERAVFSEISGSIDIITQARCIEGGDPTTATIGVQVDGAFPTYTYELVNITGGGSGTVVQNITALDDNNHTFFNVDPDATYIVRVFGGNTSSEDPTETNNCFIEIPVEGLDIPLDFTATAGFQKLLTCEPAELVVNIDVISLGTQDPDQIFTYTIDEIPGNIFSGDDIILIDDSINEPEAVDDSDGDSDTGVDGSDGRIINYIDLSGGPEELTIRVSSPDGCIVESTVTVTPYINPTVTVESFQNVECYGVAEGEIIVSSEQGGIPIVNPSYTLFSGDDPENLTEITTQDSGIFQSLAGDNITYTIVVTNGDGCTAQVVHTITQPDEFTAPEITAPEFVCEEDTVNIQITTDVTGGTTPYRYELFEAGVLLITRDTAAEIEAENLGAGTYQLRVFDDNECEVETEELVIQNLVLTLSSSPVPPVASCSPDTDAPTAEVTISGAFSIAGADTVNSYNITSGPLTGQSSTDGIFNLPMGTYTIQATTSLGTCTEEIEIIVDEIPEIDVSILPGAFVCGDDEDGVLQFSVSTFNDTGAGYEYTLISNTGDIADRTASAETAEQLIIGNLPAGVYTLELQDNVTSCMVTLENIEIIRETVELDPVANIELDCFGDSQILTISPTDGNIAQYEYSFNGGTTFQTANAIEASVLTGTSRTYNYVVRNIDTQCIAEGSVDVTQPQELLFASEVITNLVCSDDETIGNLPGSYEITISGGTPNYTFTLFNEAEGNILVETQANTTNTEVTFEGLDDGDYVVMIEDANGCSIQQDFIILPPPLGDSINFVTVADCTDQVTLFFEVALDTGSLVGDDFTIAQRLNPDSGEFVDPSVSDMDNVSQIGDGDFPPTFASVSATFDPFNTDLANRRVFAVTGLDYDIVGGVITLFDSSTNCSYSLVYATETSPDVSVIATPFGAGACDPASGIVDIEFLTANDSTVDIEIFRDGGDGTILASETGIVTISNVLDTRQITGLPTGNLVVRVQETGGRQCNATDQFRIEVAPELDEPLFVFIPRDCDIPARLTVAANGGTTTPLIPYRFALTAPGAAEPADGAFVAAEFLDVDQALYEDPITGQTQVQLWVIDASGCTESVLVDEAGFPEIALTVAATDIVPSNDCIEGQGARIVLNNIATWRGTPPYSYKVNIAGSDSSTFAEITDTTVPLFITATEGDFIVTITDVLRCEELEFPVTIAPIVDLEVSIDDVPLTCNDDGSITLNITNATPEDITNNTDPLGTYTYQLLTIDGAEQILPAIKTDDISQTFANITTAGTYRFSVYRSNDECPTIIDHVVDDIEQIGINDLRDFRLNCNGDDSGVIAFDITNLIGDVDYEITDSTDAIIAAGTIMDYGDATATITTSTDPVSDSFSPPTIDVATGTVSINGFIAEDYTITLTAGTTDSEFCTTDQGFRITEPEPFTNFLQVITELSCINGSAELLATVTGGTGDYTYQLFRGTTAIATNTTGIFNEDVIGSADTYTVEVTDENGCPFTSNAVNISDPVEPILEVEEPDDLMIDCTGGTTAFTVEITNNPTDPNYIYTLYAFDSAAADGNRGLTIEESPVTTALNFTFNPVAAGRYIAEVTDGFSCVSIVDLTVTEPDPLEFGIQVLEREVSCSPTNERFTIQATGGTTATGNYTYDRLSAPISEGGMVLESQTVDIGDFDGLNDEVYFRVTDDNGCEDFLTFNANPIPEDVDFTLDPELLDQILCVGEPGGTIEIIGNTASGGVGNYEYNLYLNGNDDAVMSSNETSTFVGLIPGTYEYEVRSGTGEGTCSIRKIFTIDAYPELIFDTVEVTPLGCPTDNDAMVRLKVAEGLGIGPFQYILTPADDSTPPVALIDGNTLTFDATTDTIEAVFEFLAPGNYVYTVVDNGTNCVGPSDFITIEEKEPFSFTFNEDDSVENLCEGDINGFRAYDLAGGSPPYFAYLSTDINAPAPDPTAPPAGVVQVPDSDTFDATIIGESLPYLVENLAADTEYVIYFYDSGNGLVGEDLRLCNPLEDLFIYETEDLDNFEPIAEADCALESYVITVNNNSEIDDDDLITHVVNLETNLDTPFPGLTTGPVVAGQYEVYLESTVTGCISQTPVPVNLETFTPVMFIEVDDEGNAIQPFIPTNEVNVYQLQVEGGVNPGGINPYTFEAFFSSTPFTDIETTVVQSIPVDSDGFFEIEVEGFYVFRVIDNFGDNGVTCFDVTNDIGLNVIDLDIPNVFNPSSDDPLMSTWFPENLTTAFGNGDVPLKEDEVGLPNTITNTGGTIEGGSTSGGTTTDGVTTGGTVTGGGTPITIPFDTTSADNTTTITFGGSIGDNGTITGGTTIVINNNNGSESVTVFENTTVTGGTISADGTVTGGTYTGGTPITSLDVENIGGNDVYVITTDGISTGDTVIGGTTTGGTTSYTGVITDGNVDSSGAFITTGGTTTGGTITNSTVTGGTTVVITLTDSGLPIIEYTTNTTVTGGTTTEGTTQGGTTSGGTLSGGLDSTDDIPFIDYENMQTFVYDRYGRLLEEFRGIREKAKGEEGWNGTYQGKPMPSGDYWYLIKLNDSEGREFTGHFTLYRKF